MKEVLFICPKYFDYYSKIIDVMKKKYSVSFIFDENDCIKKIKELNICFDILFVIRGEYLSPEIIKMINSHRKILYEWDSMLNFDYKEKAQCFDRVLTFDKRDADLYGYDYLPLFYSKIKKQKAQDIDLLFVGIWHSDRCQILESIRKQLSRYYNLKFYIYYPWYYSVYLILKGKMKFSRYLTGKKISSKKLLKLYSRAKCVVDINHNLQTGFTMRTMETLGNNIKLITTNFNIIDADFYDKNNVFVINRQKPEINLDFLNTSFVENNRMDKYELNKWLDTILE